MDPAAPPSPPVVVAVCVALAYVALVVVWRRPHWVIQHAWVVLAALAAVSLASAWALVDFRTGEVRVRLDASEEPLMVRGDPAREVYERATLTFGNDDVFVIAMVTDDVFTGENLEALRRISNQVLHLPGVRRAESLVDILSYRFDPAQDWIDVARFIDEIPHDPTALADLRRRALTDPIYPKLVVSRDGSTAAINVSFEEISDREFVDRGLDEKIRAIAESEATPTRSFHFAGRPHVKARTAAIMGRDLSRLIPLAVLVAAGVVYLTTGSLRGVLLPLVTCLTSVLWTFGLLAWTGTSINLITLVLAPVLISLGGLYGVHIFARWELEVEEAPDAAGAALATLDHEFLPVFLSGATTAAGFAALITSGIPGIQELGTYASLGTALLTVIALAGIPAALALLPLSRGAPRTRAAAAFVGRIDRWLEALGGFCSRRATAVLAAWALAAAIGLVAIPHIVVDTDYLTFFDARSDVRRDFAAVNARLIGPVPLYVELRGRGEGAFREPENLRRIEALQRALDEVPGVSASLSMVDVVKQLNRALERGDPAEERIPDSREEVADLVFMAPKGDFRRFATSNQSATNVIVRTAELGSRAIRMLVSRIEAEVARLGLEPALEVEVTGNAVVLNRSADALAGNQISSIALASAAIFALVYGAFRSTRLAGLVMIPNLTPVILFFGLLGLGLAPLSLPTGMIGCSVLGVAVDDTVHSVVSYRRLRGGGATPEQAVLVTMGQVGRPMVVTSLMLVAGFLTITTSGFATIREFGWLSALTIAVCLAADLVMLPALLVRARA